jgi:subtilisin family serine protease
MKMPNYPKQLQVGPSDQKTTYELAEDQFLVRIKPGIDEAELTTFLRAESLESEVPPEHVRRAEATLKPAGLKWISVGGRFSTLGASDTLLEERDDLDDALPVYYERGRGPESAATPLFDTLLVTIEKDRQKEAIKDLKQLGLKHSERISSLMAPQQIFRVPSEDGESMIDRAQELARRARNVSGVLDVEFDWLKLETYQAEPDDTLYSNQWNMVRINAQGAWDIEQGDSDVWVGIIDSGFDLDHPDLHFTPNEGDELTHFNAEEWLDDKAPPFNAGSVGVHHGTAVAGIAAAAVNNNMGVAGVAGGCSIMPIRLGNIPSAVRVAAGINWASAKGAHVANMSFSTSRTEATVKAVENAWDAGMVLCAATGNSGADGDSPPVGFPASHPRTIAVGASDLNDQRKRPSSSDGECWGSQYGDEIDVVAPGVQIWTTDERRDTGYNDNHGGPKSWACIHYDVSGDSSGDYVAIFNGTSAATPHVTGLVALMISANPSLSNQEVRNILEASCEKVSNSLYKYENVQGRSNGLWNKEMGYGRINAERALNGSR